MEKVQFVLEGLTCEACTKIITNRLAKNIDGIEDIDVQKNGDVSFNSESTVTEEMIGKALVDTDLKFVKFK